MSTVTETRTRDCTACRIVGSVGLLGIGAYLANAAWANRTLAGRIVISSFSLAFVTLGVARYREEYPFNKKAEKT